MPYEVDIHEEITGIMGQVTNRKFNSLLINKKVSAGDKARLAAALKLIAGVFESQAKREADKAMGDNDRLVLEGVVFNRRKGYEKNALDQTVAQIKLPRAEYPHIYTVFDTKMAEALLPVADNSDAYKTTKVNATITVSIGPKE